MAERKLVVQIVGDASSLESTFEQATKSTKKFGKELTRSTAAGRPLDPLLADVRRLKTQADDLRSSLRPIASESGQGFGRLAVRLGLVGAAAGVAFSAMQHLREGLKTTGDEAFTATGRIKNFTAALLSGDLIGGIQALSAQESRLAPDLEKAVAEMRRLRDESSRISMQDVLDQTEHFDAVLAQTTKDMIEIGIPIDEATKKTAEWRRELEQAAGVTFNNLTSNITSVVDTFVTELERAAQALEAAAKKRAAMLAGLSQLPPGIEAAISREQGRGGSEEGLLKVLRQADENLARRIEETRTKGKGRDVSEALAKLQAQRTSIQNQIKNLLKADASTTRDASEAVRKQREAFARLIGFLEIKLDVARATSTLQDDLRELDAQEKAIRAQIKVEGRTVDLERRLLDIERERAAIGEERGRRSDSQRQIAQFRALGLSATGDKPIPTIDNLTKQLSQLDEKVTGGKNQRLLNAIRKVLTDPINTATEETRQAIRDMFATIRGELDDGLKDGPLTTFHKANAQKILGGLGLSDEEFRRARARISRIGQGGMISSGSQGGAFGMNVAPVTVVANTYLDGQLISSTVTANQQRAMQSNAALRRGTHAGR